MNIATLQTVSSKSESIPDKNKLKYNNKELWQYNLEYVIKSTLITSGNYVITDYPDILNYTNGLKYKAIEDKLDKPNHYECIKYGLNYIENYIHEPLDFLIILLGNNNSAYTDDLESALTTLIDFKRDYDGCMSVSKFNMFNPYRSYYYEPTTNSLQTIIKQEDIRNRILEKYNEKNSFGDIYFFNGSFWICKPTFIKNPTGLLPFPWLGNKIMPFVQSEGIMEVDAPWQINNIKL